MTATSIDINCDLGEDFGQDDLLLPFISSMNIACGLHAGGPKTMLQLVNQAKAAGIAIGAHPSYPDREHFGRRNMQLPAKELYALILYQLGALDACCRAAGTSMKHVKPHGALYNQAGVDPILANTICAAIKDFNPRLKVFGLSGSRFLEIAEQLGLTTVSEVFADRRYTEAGTLCPRDEPGAMIEDSETAVQQVLKMIREQLVLSSNGKEIPVKAETVCLHGDGPHALVFARALKVALSDQKISIRTHE